MGQICADFWLFCAGRSTSRGYGRRIFEIADAHVRTLCLLGGIDLVNYVSGIGLYVRGCMGPRICHRSPFYGYRRWCYLPEPRWVHYLSDNKRAITASRMIRWGKGKHGYVCRRIDEQRLVPRTNRPKATNSLPAIPLPVKQSSERRPNGDPAFPTGRFPPLSPQLCFKC